MAGSRPAVPQPLDAEALSESRSAVSFSSPRPQSYRVAQSPVIRGTPSGTFPQSLPSLASDARIVMSPAGANQVLQPFATVQSRSGVQTEPLQRVRPCIPVSPRRSVQFSDWMQTADVTPNSSTYGEHPSFFNFDKNGSHIHYFDQSGYLTKAPWKDTSLSSPVDCSSSPPKNKVAFASPFVSVASPAGSSSFALAPAGSTPHATAAGGSMLGFNLSGPSFVQNSTASAGPTVLQNATTYAGPASFPNFTTSAGPSFFSNGTVPVSPAPAVALTSSRSLQSLPVRSSSAVSGYPGSLRM